MSAHRARRAPEEEPQALPPEMADVLARATREERLVALVARAAETNWRASAWLLERRFPERWGADRLRAREERVVAREGDDPFAEIDELARRRREQGRR